MRGKGGVKKEEKIDEVNFQGNMKKMNLQEDASTVILRVENRITQEPGGSPQCQNQELQPSVHTARRKVIRWTNAGTKAGVATNVEEWATLPNLSLIHI